MNRALTFITAVGLGTLNSAICAAQEPAAGDASQISREEWQARVKESQQRADVMRRERKGFLPQSPSPDQMAEEVSKQALEDDSLLPGDIVSTDHGLFQFRGSPDRERKPDDFVRIR